MSRETVPFGLLTARHCTRVVMRLVSPAAAISPAEASNLMSNLKPKDFSCYPHGSPKIAATSYCGNSSFSSLPKGDLPLMLPRGPTRIKLLGFVGSWLDGGSP